VEVTLIKAGALSEKGVGVNVGVGVWVGVAVRLGVKVGVGSGVGTGPATPAGVGVWVGEGGGGGAVGDVGGRKEFVGARVGSVKTNAGPLLINAMLRDTPRTTHTKMDAVHLPRAMLIFPCPFLFCLSQR
jgi:hypothetical protein